MRLKRPILVLLVCSLPNLAAGQVQRDSRVVQEPEAASDRPATLRSAAAASALDVFLSALNDRWSYRHANRADFDSAIAALRQRIVTDVSSDQLGIELQKIIALGIDGYAGVAGYRLPPGGCLPFLIEAEGEPFVAVNPERTAFLADGYSYLTRIDGKDVAAWCKAAAVLVPKGSPQYVRRRCLRLLLEIDYWRDVMELPKRESVEVELAGADGQARKTLTLPVAPAPPAYGVWPPGGSRLLEGNVGYLRLANMVAATSVPEIQRWLPKFRDTAGLIVDVRDNNGGDRDPFAPAVFLPRRPPRSAPRVHRRRLSVVRRVPGEPSRRTPPHVSRRRIGVVSPRTPGSRGVRRELQAAMGAAQGSVQPLALHGPHPARRPGRLPLRQTGDRAVEREVFQRHRHLPCRVEGDEECPPARNPEQRR